MNSFIVSSRILVIAAIVLLCLAAQAPASAATTELVSVASNGTQANAGSDWAWVGGPGVRPPGGWLALWGCQS